MRRRKRRLFFLLSFLSLAGLVYIILSYPPSSQFHPPIWRIQFPITIFSFALMFLTIFSFISFITNSMLRGSTYGGIASLYLYLRLIDLTHPFFLILLLSLLVTVEFVLRKR